MIKQGAQQKSLQVSTSFDDRLTTMMADERRLKQILVNLLSNSLKFTSRGGSIRVRARQLDPDSVEISVTDTGTGIPKSDLARVLEPFGQVSAGSELQHSPEGTGLGLPLTRSLVELHGGEFRLWSRLGLGTRVVARFPINQRDRIVGR